ncbi:MAG TPA: ATP-binding protein, partial [Spirochaetia bacterium]|nr:ATP-binding protein [Spirochaetia bacterium]
IFDLLEKETFVRSRFLTVGYREAGPGKILVVLTDVTLDRQLADRNRADEARRTLILRALGHKRYFAGLLFEAESLFETLRTFEERPATADEARTLLASIHTFKGNCGFFGFSLTQEVAHDFEYAISDSQVLGEELDYHDLGLDLKRSYYQELGIITDVMGSQWLEEAGGIVIPREVYDKVAKFVGKKFADETHLVDVLEHFRKMPLRDLFSRFPFVAQATAEKLGKKIGPLTITGGDIRVVPERLESLVSVCVHIVNNMVDHGIEATYVREGLGKPAEGQISLELIRENSSVVIRFSDDGQGVSFPQVEERAKRLGLIPQDATPDHRQLLQVLFEPGFSTRDEATEVSGRGIGLSAVRAEAERLGGRVEAHSKPGAGTTFEILIPIGVFANRRMRGTAPGPERRKT